MKLLKKYNYTTAPATTTTGSRTYSVAGMNLPSVTTILAKTKNQEYLTRWRKKVGHEEAERIFNLSSKRGTAMHKFLENHIKGTGYDGPYRKLASKPKQWLTKLLMKLSLQ